MEVSQLLPMLVQNFKLFRRGGKALSWTAITATLHFSDKTHGNGYDPEQVAPVDTVFHKAFNFRTGSA